MNANTLIAIALAALLVFAGGAVAMPGDAPADPGADAADEHQPDDPGAAASDAADDDNETGGDANVTEADDARDENASDGPPTEMPEQAPDHVSQIHELIREKLDGNLTGQELGAAISDLVGNGDDAQDNTQADSAGEQSAAADENATETDDAGDDTSASVAGDLPEQAADHVSSIHDAIQSFLDGDGDGNPGYGVSSAAG